MTVPEWMGSGGILGWFTVATFLISHVLSTVLVNGSMRHALAYVALFLGGAALLTSHHTAIGTVGEIKATLLAEQLVRAEEAIVREIVSAERYLCNFKGVRSPLSPPNFDDIEAMRGSACTKFKALRVYVTQDWKRSETKFSPPDVGLETISDPVWGQPARHLESLTKQHDDILTSLAGVKSSPWLFWVALEPFIIAASWSLGLAMMVPPYWWRKK